MGPWTSSFGGCNLKNLIRPISFNVWDISFCYLVFLEHRYFASQIFTIDAWKETGKPYPFRRHWQIATPVPGNICQSLARHIATRKGCFSLAMEQETRCHDPSAFYSNVEYSNDPRDGIIGSNDRAWNPLATPSSGQCVCLHPRNLFTEQSMDWYVAGRRNRCLFDVVRNGTRKIILALVVFICLTTSQFLNLYLARSLCGFFLK